MNTQQRLSTAEWTAKMMIVVGVVTAILAVLYMLFAISDLMIAIRQGATIWDALGAGHPRTADSRTASVLIAFLVMLGGAMLTFFASIKYRDLAFRRKYPDSVAEQALLMLQAENERLRRQTKERDKNDEGDGQFTD
jgi:hypothetical protein